MYFGFETKRVRVIKRQRRNNVKENLLLLRRSEVGKSLKEVDLKSRFSKSQGWSKNSAGDIKCGQKASGRQVKTITGATVGETSSGTKAYKELQKHRGWFWMWFLSNCRLVYTWRCNNQHYTHPSINRIQFWELTGKEFH